ncbi:deoxyribodipyrimidine photo-lyase [Nevskia sp.]|uniref:cryptochrome/photolyase family protein n=1 Tax=Nevskia sp. TaxID=1929292 RepID=UPI00345AC03B
MPPVSTALVWFRRDFRVADNPALIAALAGHDQVLPVYLHAPDEEAPWQPGAASRWWLHHSLTAHSARLAALGSPLVIRAGADSLAELRKLVKETGATAVHWNRLYEPALIARDTRIKQALRDDGLDAESHNSALLVEPWEVKTGGGDPYRVFTPFWRNAGSRNVREPLAAPKRIPAPKKIPSSLGIDKLKLLPTIRWDDGFYADWTPGEAGAWTQAEAFFADGAARYKEQRDLPAQTSTSSLSPHLHFGEIGPVQLVHRTRRLVGERQVQGLTGNIEHFVRELGWREFSHHLLFHFPTTPDQPLYPKFAAFPWRAPEDYAADLHAWQRGRTGVPIVDAGMRQLWTTGWMHNRVRMIVASFLTKNLLIPWQEGARWFWDTLVDASLAQNSLGWQWSAGCGADAALYFRIFNPVLQSGKFDCAGVYLRHWVPEIARLPDASLHAPWEAKPAVWLAAKFSPGQDYPKPIVSLSESRDRALAAYARIKGPDTSSPLL